MTIDDRLRALEKSGADPALMRAIRLLIEQRNRALLMIRAPHLPIHQDVSKWIQSDNAAVLAAMDG